LEDLRKHDQGEAGERFGQLLHTAQDFYAHSNWVESGQTELVSPGLGEWPQFSALEQMPSGVVLLAKSDGHEPKGAIKVSPDLTVSLQEGAAERRGIITGAVWREGKCPSATHGTVGHWSTA